jgi:hypothetical protein
MTHCHSGLGEQGGRADGHRDPAHGSPKEGGSRGQKRRKHASESDPEHDEDVPDGQESSAIGLICKLGHMLLHRASAQGLHQQGKEE